jgi:hypothetical protein
MKRLIIPISLIFIFFSQAVYSGSNDFQLSGKNIVLIKEAFNFQYKFGRQLWPGWTEAKYPLRFITTKYDYLVNHPNPPEEYTKKYYCKELGSDVWYRENKDSLFYLASYPINGLWAVVVSAPPEDYNIGEWITKFAHECFHVYQSLVRKERIVNPFTGNYAGFNELNFPFDYDNANVKAAMRLEAEHIYNIVTADSINSFTTGVYKKLFQCHQTILQNVISDKNKFMYKQWQEWMEGIARYTERELARIAKNNPAAASDEFKKVYPDVDYVNLWQEKYLTAINPIRFIGEGVKGRVAFYYSGMGKAYFLEKVLPNWKDKYFEENLDQLIQH